MGLVCVSTAPPDTCPPHPFITSGHNLGEKTCMEGTHLAPSLTTGSDPPCPAPTLSHLYQGSKMRVAAATIPPGPLEGSRAPAVAVPAAGCAALLFPLRTAEAGPRPRSERGGSCSSSSSRGCSASAIAQRSLPSLSPPSQQRLLVPRRVSQLSPLPRSDDTRNRGDNVALGASCIDRRSFSCWAVLGGQSTGKSSSRLFPPAPQSWWQRCHPAVWQMELVVSFSPACPCCSSASAIEGLGHGDQHALPTRAVLCSSPHALAPQQGWGCSCSPQIHSLSNWGNPDTHPQSHCYPQILTEPP